MKEYYQKIAIGTVLPVGGSLVAHNDGSTISNITLVDSLGIVTCVVDDTISAFGAKSLKVNVAAPAVDVMNFLQFGIPAINRGGVIISASVMYRQGALNAGDGIGLWFELITGVYKKRAGVWIDHNRARVQYRNPAGEGADVPGATPALGVGLWHNMEFKYNTKTGEYLTLNLDNQLIDMSGLLGELKDIYDDPFAARVLVEVDAQAATAAETHVQHLMVICD